MPFRRPSFLIAVPALLCAAAPAFAHHQFGVEFDANKCTNLKSLTGIDWENLHAYFHMDMTNSGGRAQSWGLEMITPNALKRNGTTRQDFLDNVGKPVSARACPAKAGGTQYRGSAEFLQLADGEIRVVGQNVERGLTPDKLHF
jgi:Family of unknown function (DUF6152)